ncbi:MAG: FAD-dependent oxidoreductase [Pseudomonadota bacterium]
MSSNTLPDQASVVVVGGGVMGCSTLYHLAKLGLDGLVLLERNQLTSGTTWHSAAQVRQLRSTRNMTRLVQYSANLYPALEEETGQTTGWNRTGSLSIAANADRWIHVRRQSALAHAYDVNAHEVSLDEVRALWPLMHTDDLVGAVYSPDDGRVNPSDLCLALSKGARNRGALIFENTGVTGVMKGADGRIAGVRTDSGDISAERVVICGGLWSRELAGMAGFDAPILPCEHFYLLTKPMDGISGHLPTLSDHDSHLYIRDDVGGLLVGCFEPEGKPLDPAMLGPDFAFSLLNEDWDHFEPMMLNALHRIPALAEAEVRTLLNGPESFTPDSSFLLGEAASVPGLFLGCGMNSVGVATGGGAGWALAQWIADGAPAFDLGEVNPNRFHAVENRLEHLMARAPEVLGRHYEIHYPGRQWASARDLRLTPMHTHWQAHKARFGQVYGWERPLYFGADGEPELRFGQPVWFEAVGREVAAATTGAALFDQSTFGKIKVSGPDAEAFLQRVCANDMSRAPGRAIYTAMLNEKGGYLSDFTALRLAVDEYLLYVGTTSTGRDLGWLMQNLGDANVELEDVTEDLAVLGLMGPRAPSLAAQLGADLGGLGYFHHVDTTLAGESVRAVRLSYVGEAGWEFTMPAAVAHAVGGALIEAGAVPAGLLAQTSMRIEKRFVSMGHDIDGDTTPLDAGLMFAVRSGGGFVGAAALEGATARSALVSIVLDDELADPHGHEPIYANGELIGQATSAAFGYRVGQPVALGLIKAGVVRGHETVAVELDIAGDRLAGTASLSPAFDPTGERMRPRR